MSFNISGTLGVLRLVRDPSLCLPHSSVPTFGHLPVPLSSVFEKHATVPIARPDIRAVILDKDNCFAVPKSDHIYDEYKTRFEQLRREFPGPKMVIVSNTAGSSSDRDGVGMNLLARKTGVQVLQHETKKPGCHAEIMRHFQSHPETQVTSPSQIAVIGDRLFTDVMMANLMGSHSIWITDGVVKNNGLFTRVEKMLSAFLMRRGYTPPSP